METRFNVVISSTGTPVAGATISVFFDDGTTLAPLFETDGVTSQPNPFQTNSEGEYRYRAVNGRYVEKIEFGATEENIPGVVLFDPTDTFIDTVRFPFYVEKLTAAQTVITTGFAITNNVSNAGGLLGGGHLVFINGLLQLNLLQATFIGGSSDYSVTNDATGEITLASGATADDIFVFVGTQATAQSALPPFPP